MSTERQKLSAILHIILGNSLDESRQEQTAFKTNAEWLDHLLVIHKQFCSNVGCGATTQAREHSLHSHGVTSTNLAEQEEDPQSHLKRHRFKTGASHTVERTTERVRPKTEPLSDDAVSSGTGHMLIRKRTKRTESSVLNTDHLDEGSSVSGGEDNTGDTHGYRGDRNMGDIIDAGSEGHENTRRFALLKVSPPGCCETFRPAPSDLWRLDGVTSTNLAEQEKEPQSRLKRHCFKTGASHTVERTTERVRPKTEPLSDDAVSSGTGHMLKRKRTKRTESSALNNNHVHEGSSVSEGEDNTGDTHGYRGDGLHSDYWGGAGESDNEENHNRDEELTHDQVLNSDRLLSLRSNTTRSKQERQALIPTQLSEFDQALDLESLVGTTYETIETDPTIIKLHSLRRYSKLGFMEQRGEKFRCNLCMFTSKYSDSMRSHVKFVHLITVSRFRCLLCGKYFKRRKDLTKHLRNLHSYVADK